MEIPKADPGTTGGGDTEELGTVVFELAVVPPAVQCLRVTASPQAGGAVSQNFTLAAGAATTTLSLGMLPNGPVVITASAFNVACASLGQNTATWIADPIMVTVRAGTLVTTMLNLRANNVVRTSVNFVPNITGIAAGGLNSFALTDAAPFQWGFVPNSYVPVRLTNTTPAKNIAAGFYHACALRADGTVWCWGWNLRGGVGPGVPIEATAAQPVQVPLPGPATMIAAAVWHSCAYVPTSNSSGGVFCWGYNGDGELGNGTRTDSASPVAVLSSNGQPFDQPLRHLTSGSNHLIAARADGMVFGWGANQTGQLGDGSLEDRLFVTQTLSERTAVSVGGGANHSCALRADGSVSCWGLNEDGQLGDGTTVNRFVPGPLVTLPGPATQLAIGGSAHSCVRLADGRAACWGYNGTGAVGDLSATTRPTPVVIGFGSETVLSLALGSNHSCALTSGQNVQCWGQGFFGQVGDGTANTAFGPTKLVF